MPKRDDLLSYSIHLESDGWLILRDVRDGRFKPIVHRGCVDSDVWNVLRAALTLYQVMYMQMIHMEKLREVAEAANSPLWATALDSVAASMHHFLRVAELGSENLTVTGHMNKE